jgi:hypothetical protein
MTQTISGVTVGHVAVFGDVRGNIIDGGAAPDAAQGTVTSVSVSTAAGVSGSVATPTTTPAITITLGAITPSSVTATGTVTGSNLSGTNTGDSTAPAQVLTGFTSGAGTVTSSDTILTAIEKINGNTALLTGAVVFQGLWNATTNTPTLTSGTGTKGFLYTTSVAGTTSLDGINQWNVGDQAVFNGTVWEKIDGLANEVVSVAGRTGVITLAVGDVSGAVANTTTVNGHALGGNVVVSGSDITTGTIPIAQLPVGTASAKGILQVDGTTITVTAGVISAASSAPAYVSSSGTATASGTSSFAGGPGSSATQTGSIAIGLNASGTGTTGFGAIAIGNTASASGSVATALGYSSTASGGNSTAIGESATASASSTVAIGPGATAAGAQSVVLGNGGNDNAQAGCFVANPTQTGTRVEPTGANQIVLATDAGNIKVNTSGGFFTSSNDAVLHHVTTTLANGAASGAGTISNAPASGNPTKWIAIDDNGTTRHIPAW